MCTRSVHSGLEVATKKLSGRGGPLVGTKKGSSKRELIDTGSDKRYVRRDAKGQFKESDDQGRSLAQDVKKKAKTKVESGQGDRGDQQRG